MIEYLRHMAVFALVVDEGSFRAAARALNVAPSRVSETVSDLEAYLGRTLLNRSTRKTALTNEGRIFYNRVVEMVRSAEAGLNDLNALTIEPVGTLKVSMPAFMSSSGLARTIGEFAGAHPLVSLSVDFSDRPVGLIEAGYDVNIRVGWLDDSAMMSRKLGEEDRMLVAGSDYAASRTKPTHPKDLEGWDWIGYDQRQDTIAFERNGKTENVAGRSHLRVDSVDALYTFTAQNLGATVMPNHLAQRGINEGVLQRLLPDWQLRPLGFYAVWPDKSRRESLALLFVRFLADNYDRACS
ncbi:LysR family transcriptional regulator [Cognatiyoonia sp. IB215446]|uniref:LysR family transcriptional regulator n=1 Tax=Cognatiyoonia sp. IB215446 TaxID=3097355 RepID=UPI002A0E55E6|nr:LysR family transcriptional regulator [Cognatiyoonia sp. IB215446]MDX8349987.1 LysR family transcriptional regulator [Cognatiyoonia sp. IB215446]